MNKRINITSWIENFNNGLYDNSDFSTQVSAGWYDWFCKDSLLANKTKVLGKKVIQISKSPKINCETSYVWFKNNCLCCGKLYDDFRIADIKTRDVIYTVIPKSGHDNNFGVAEVWGRENDFKGPLVEGSWKTIKKFFEV